MPPRRLRLDAELVRRGLARSREQAAELVGAGRVKVSGAVATKPATAVTTDVAIVVVDGVGERGFLGGNQDADDSVGVVRGGAADMRSDDSAHASPRGVISMKARTVSHPAAW